VLRSNGVWPVANSSLKYESESEYRNADRYADYRGEAGSISLQLSPKFGQAFAQPIIADSSASAYVGSIRGYRTAKVLNLPEEETDLAYLACLLDGPGSITWRDAERKFWRVRVSTSARELIDYLVTIAGTWSQRLPKERRHFVYEWDLSRQEHVRDFLRAVAPYLKTYDKQARAREAVRRIDARIGNKP
jgi:hypothetical protein